MNRSSSFKTDKHQAPDSPKPRIRMARNWEPVLSEDELAVALAKKETDRLMATELERKLLRLRARRLER
jgi:hypothetical protein